ncbi:ABCA1, partial [Symbiodinium microadriaticum]
MFILGLGLSITALVLRFIPSTHDLLVDTLRYVFVLFPPCALGEGMNNLALRTYYSDLELGGNRQYDAMDWNICGLNILVMGIEGVAFILLTILVDYTSTTSRLRKYPAASVPVLVKDIKKRYPSGNYAVKGVSLAIPHGECFGLLGVNGAGKSSLLNMLSGEFGPTSGDAFLAGHSVVTDMAKCRYHIGFCPQFDAIYDLLSAREHLNFYAAVKGIRPQHIPEEVKHKISDLGLTEYADRAAGGYSGGNKRKLSVAMAMVAEPAIMFLDEPSTGMDPMARRFMWEVIGDLVTRREKCSLILTTHSME